MRKASEDESETDLGAKQAELEENTRFTTSLSEALTRATTEHCRVADERSSGASSEKRRLTKEEFQNKKQDLQESTKALEKKRS